MKLRSRLLMVFGQNFFEKWQIWVSEPHFGEVRGDARPWLMARWKTHGQLSIRLNWTFFVIYYGSAVMRQKLFTARLFHSGSTFWHSNFIWTGSSPINYSWQQKTRDTGLPKWWRSHPSASRRFETIPECDGRTDRQTDGWTDMP